VKEHNRTVSINIVTDSGLCAMACIDPRHTTIMIHWYMHHEVKGMINTSFTYEINRHHYRKATNVCADFPNVCEILDDKIIKIRNGEAVTLPTINTIHPAKQQPTSTNTMQTLQPNPAEVARKATSTRDNIRVTCDILRHLFKGDNDAPRLFAEQFADVLTEHGWNDPRTAEHHDKGYSELQIKLDEAKTEIEELESKITELEAEIEDLTDNRE